jgi:hypothetical protein
MVLCELAPAAQALDRMRAGSLRRVAAQSAEVCAASPLIRSARTITYHHDHNLIGN